MASQADNDQDQRDGEGGEGQEVGQAHVEVSANVAVEIHALRKKVDEPKSLES